MLTRSFIFLFPADSKWEELHPGGERPPALQEHSAVAYKDCLYIFGGELGFSAGTETPLWVYNVKVTYHPPRADSNPFQTSLHVSCVDRRGNRQDARTIMLIISPLSDPSCKFR